MKAYKKWTEETCQKEALKYNTRIEFCKKAKGAYNFAYANKIQDKICSHMKPISKQTKWTKELCHERALKYNSRYKFSVYDKNAYNFSLSHGWINEVCSHMVPRFKPNKYWSKQRCQEEALKYKTRTEFRNNSTGAASAAQKHGWIDEICSHMKAASNMLYKRVVYAFEFEDNHVYVGLTCNMNNRKNSHFTEKKSAVYRHMEKTGLIPKLVVGESMTQEQAKVEEGLLLNKYKNKNWNILNKAKTGGLGGNIIKWTKKKVYKESLKYKTRTEFKKNSPGAYASARNHNWLMEIFLYMKEVKRWSKETCKKEALKYNSRYDFSKNSPGAYQAAKRINALEEICSHMKWINRPNGYWTKKNCREVALQFTTKRKFYNERIDAYSAASRNGWLDEICSHMTMEILVQEIKNSKDSNKCMPKGYWTKEKITELSLGFSVRNHFRMKHRAAYERAMKNGWLDEICSHMKEVVRWTKETCQQEASKYKTRKDFKLGSGSAYECARRNKWLNDLCSKMKY